MGLKSQRAYFSICCFHIYIFVVVFCDPFLCVVSVHSLTVLFFQVQKCKCGTEMKVFSLRWCTLLSVLITLFIRTPSSVLY